MLKGGDIFGCLKVLGVSTKRAERNRTLFHCVCVVCGLQTEKKSCSIRKSKGSSTLCYCKSGPHKMVGETFGSLKVLRESHRASLDTGTLYECLCLVCRQYSTRKIKSIRSATGTKVKCFCRDLRDERSLIKLEGHTLKEEGKKKEEGEEYQYKSLFFSTKQTGEILLQTGFRVYLGRSTYQVARRYAGNNLWEVSLEKIKRGKRVEIAGHKTKFVLETAMKNLKRKGLYRTKETEEILNANGVVACPLQNDPIFVS